MASNAIDYDRERGLLQTVQLRIANAGTDKKLSDLLHKYLSPLVKKCATENEYNLNLTIQICEYVLRRVEISAEIKLPIEELLKTFREDDHLRVKEWCHTFIASGLKSLSNHEAMLVLPAVLQTSIPGLKTQLTTEVYDMWITSLNFLLKVLQTWDAPAPRSPADNNIQLEFALQPDQCASLAETLTAFIAYALNAAHIFGRNDEAIRGVFERYYDKRLRIVPGAGRLLFTSLFTDDQRLCAATLLSAETVSTAESIGDRMFKQCNFDLESKHSAESLFSLYKITNTKVRIKIVSLLSKSKISTDYTDIILSTVRDQLESGQSGLDATKLRAAVFSYLAWCIKLSPLIRARRSEFIEALREYIALQGWPEMNHKTVGEMDLRAKAYESIGVLAGNTRHHEVRQLPDQDVLQTSLALVTWLFSSLANDTTPNIRSSIEESLGRTMNDLQVMDDESQRKLKELLLWHATATLSDTDPWFSFPIKNSTKYPAVRFANKALPYDDIDARYIDLLAVGSEQREVAEEGNRGLQPYWHMSNQKLEYLQQQPGSINMPDLSSMVTRVFGNAELDIDQQNLTMNLYVISTAVLFCRDLLVYAALQDTPSALTIDSDLQPKVEAALQHNAEARDFVKIYIKATTRNTIQGLLRACLTGMQQGDSQCAQIGFELASLMSNDALSAVKDEVLQISTMALSNAKLQDYAARLIGICAGLDSSCPNFVRDQVYKITEWRTAIGSEVVKIKGHVTAAAFAQSRRDLRVLSSGSGSINDDLVTSLYSIALTSNDGSLKDCASLSLAQLCLCSREGKLPMHKSQDLVQSLVLEAKKEKELALYPLGPVLNYLLRVNSDNGSVQETLDRLFALHEVKRAEFHFALGDTLAVAACGFRSLSTLTLLDVDEPKPSFGYNETFLSSLMSRLLEDCKTTKPSLKKATGIWLLCLIENCGNEAPVKSVLRACQAAFARLLNDRDEIVQETGSRGLSLVYEKGDKALRDDLVRDLVQSFTGTGPKIAVSEDTELFEPGALPTENGQSVSTYKDIVSLATEVGDPSLVYRFMNLASNNAIWNSRAAFGRFGLGSILADNNYLTENKKFYPKLYRYRFDPNPNVQRSMEDIWKGLVKSPTDVIDKNFDLILEDLLKSITLGKDWRAREASCAAIADLIQGQQTEKYEKYLAQIWENAFKVLDDLKGSVRIAAMKLCKTLTNMLIRNLETGDGTTKRARTLLEHSIRFLLKQMTSGAGREVQSYAVGTLLEIIKKSPPKSLRPFAPEILEQLVLGLSSLEHEMVNYVHLNADKYGVTAAELDQMRVSSINTSPVTEAIERCLEALSIPTYTEKAASGDLNRTNSLNGGSAAGVLPDATLDSEMQQGENSGSTTDVLPDAVLDDAMQKLGRTFKSAIGLPSRVGLSRVIMTLVVQHQVIFRPYADMFVSLVRKSLLDRNATISVAFSTALAYLLRLASEKEISLTSRYAQKLYFESQELSHRSVAGEILQATSKFANDIFMNYATLFLPFAFIGHNDTESEVREKFDTPWKDNVGGSRAVILYLSDIVELANRHIKSTSWPIRHACCFAIAEMMSSFDVPDGLPEKEALSVWPLVEEALGGKTWVGKEKVVLAYPNFVKHAKRLWSHESISTQMKVIAFREAKRSNVSYRPHAVRALGEFSAVREDLIMSSDVLSLLTDLLKDILDGDQMEVDAGDGSESAASIPLTLEAIATCLFKALPQTDSDTNILDRSLQIVERCRKIQSTNVEMALSDGAKHLFTKLKKRHSFVAEETSHSERGPISPQEMSERLAVAVLDETKNDGGDAREGLRRSRVELLDCLVRSGTLTLNTRSRLALLVEKWLREERSRPIKDVLEHAGKVLRA